MYFKKLELVGFKSFMDKTTLYFEPGITAVVGPNGCGKSNIFDSIRWVLGEQSVKALRGSQMEDVIFNGTDAKESVGMAEVSLVFENKGRFFPFDHDEVMITRRIFRSGESEYLLNKAQVRLKDITDLLAGTGIGAESYSLVEQGKIDLVLSSKPEDRRLVFDEAAGITRYKSQKREALRRLEETEQNLLRVSDIINEVRRQIASLERQAAKARRYKEAFEELKNKEVDLGVIQSRKILDEKNSVIDELKRLQNKEADFLTLLKDQEAQLNLRNQELKSLEEAMMQIKGQVLTLDNLLIRHQQHIDFNKERIGELEKDQAQLTAQLEQTQAKILLDEQKLNSAKQEFETIHNEVTRKDILHSQKQQVLEGLLGQTKAALENITASKKELLGLSAGIAHVKNEINESSAKQQIHLARKKRLDVEKAKICQERSLSAESLDNVTRELEALAKEFQDLTLRLTGLKEESRNNTVSLNQLKSQVVDLEREILALESHKEFLEELKTKYDDISESMEASIYLNRMPKDKVSGLVVKIKDYPDPVAINAQAGGSIQLKGEAKPIDLDTQRIQERIDRIRTRIALLNDETAAKEATISRIDSSIEQLQDSLRSQEIALANKKNLQQNILEQFNKIKEEEEVVAIELKEVSDESASAEKKISALCANLSELEVQQRRVDELILSTQAEVTLKNNQREGVLIEITQLKAELEALNQRLVSDRDTFKLLEETYNQDKESLASMQSQIKDTHTRIKTMGGEIFSLESKIRATRQELSALNIGLKENQAKYDHASSDVNAVLKKIEADRKALDELKSHLYDLEIRNKDLDFKLLSLKERILQGYKIDLDSVSRVATLSEQEIDEGALSQEIERLKEKVDNYGTVNLVAIEEYDELKKRYDFLTQQQSDLNTAKESLHEAILKLNRDTKKMFLETLEKIQVEFRNYFKLLFNGGDAQIFLIDEHDPLESGIEIICRPPGKRLQNVLLLSGGEKSLSATALIFAIFKIKPSPFCILDEIDAALDEANVDRFGRMLHEFSKTSQFIVITHNKKTIANANVMYGITMEQSGISKIVSVKFAENKAKLETNQHTDLVAETV